MVQKHPRKQIVFLLTFTALIIVASAVSFLVYIHMYVDDGNIVYSATNNSLDLEVLDGIVAADAKGVDEKGFIKAVIIPHHMVAAESIARGVRLIASSSPKLIVVISPDHYGRCETFLCTTRGQFKTFFGDVSISNVDVAQLVKKSNSISESDLFKEEHGIYSVIPFIKYYAPQAQVVPIVISQQGKGTEQGRSQMVSLLQSILTDKNSVLVVSSDFSHYLPLNDANAMDEMTQSVICSGDDMGIFNLKNPQQSDCPLCLWVAEQETKKLGFWNPHVVVHTNSAQLLNDVSARETTSHFVVTLSDVSPYQGCPVTIRN